MAAHDLEQETRFRFRSIELLRSLFRIPRSLRFVENNRKFMRDGRCVRQVLPKEIRNVLNPSANHPTRVGQRGVSPSAPQAIGRVPCEGFSKHDNQWGIAREVDDITFFFRPRGNGVVNHL
jgi:hypothetical protein